MIVSDQLATDIRMTLGRRIAALQSLAGHWIALPTGVRAATDYANRLVDSGATDEVVRQVAQKVIDDLSVYIKLDPMPLSSIGAVLQDGRRLLDLAKSLPGFEKDGSLWQCLHGTIEQRTAALEGGALEKAVSSIRDVHSRLDALDNDDIRSACAEMAASAETVLSGDSQPADVQDLIEHIERLRALLPDDRAAAVTPRAVLSNTRHFHVAIVEDDDEWYNDVVRALDIVREYLGPCFVVDHTRFEDLETASAALANPSPTLPTTGSDEAVVQTIAMVDLGIPSSPQETQRVRDHTATPLRDNGKALLRKIRSYRNNVPSIVLTTPSNLLDDQLDCCAMGVGDYDYIIKGVDKHDRIADAIIRVVERAQAHRISLTASPKQEARIDGVPIALGEMPFRTFYCLCELSQQTRKRLCTPEQILDQLDESFGDVFDYRFSPETELEKCQVLARRRSGNWWKSQWVLAIVNVMRLWASSKADAGGDGIQALGKFEENWNVYRNALSLFDDYRRSHPNGKPWSDQMHLPVNRVTPDVLAAGFDEAFGGLEFKSRSDYDLDNIKKHMNEVRTAIHEAFNAVHKTIDAKAELIISRQMGEDLFGYRVVGDIDFDEEDTSEDLLGNAHKKQSVVLVVENETGFRNRIAELFKTAGYTVLTATNAEDAVAEATGIDRPDIISLDLHIPLTRLDYEKNPDDGATDGGLQALGLIREKAPDVKVLVPTTLYDRDDLREMAASLDVPVTNFVPKGGGSAGSGWEGHLLLTAGRLKQELETGSILPSVPRWKCHIVQLLAGSDPKHGKLKLLVSGRQSEFSGKEGKLLALLLRRPREEVTYDDIAREVWGVAPSPNARNSKINDVRKKIRSDWLGLPLAEAKTSERRRQSGRISEDDEPEQRILETSRERGTAQGLVLNVYVEDPHHLMTAGTEPRQ